MAMKAQEFLGRLFRKPGSYAAFRTTPDRAGLSPDLKTRVVAGFAPNGWYVGDASAEIDQRVMEFGSFEEARAVLREGQLLDAIRVAFNPSQDTRFVGPQLIRAMNVAQNTAASYTAGADYDDDLDYEIRYAVPGTHGNTARFRISASGNRLEVGDNNGVQNQIGLRTPEIEIGWDGTGDATEVVLHFDGSAFTTVLTDAGPDDIALNIAVTDDMTTAVLADRINAVTGYTASLLSGGDTLVKNLDHTYIAGVSIFAGPTVMESTLLAQTRALFDLGNMVLDVDGPRRPLADMAGFAWLEGGGTAAPIADDWMEAINLLDRAPGFYKVFCTHIPGVIASLVDYARRANSPEGQRECVAAAGSQNATPLAERIEHPRQYNSEFLVYGISPIKVYRADGVTPHTYDGWMAALLHHAIKASTNVRESAFYKDLNILDAPEVLSETEIKNALATGSLIVDRKPNRGPFKITHDLTTFQRQDYVRNKAASIALALAMIQDLRISLETAFLGETPLDPNAQNVTFTDTDILNFIEAKFDVDYVQRYGWLSADVLTNRPAFDPNFVVERQGNAIFFRLRDGRMVTSIDYIFSLLNLDVVGRQ